MAKQANDEFPDPMDVLNHMDTSQIGAPGTNTGIVGPAQPRAFDREAYKTGWSGGNADQLKSYNDTWGVPTNKDVSYLPTSEALDMIGDVGGKNNYGWTGLGSWSGTPGQGATITPNAGGGGLPAGGAAPGSSGGSPFQDQLRQIILSQLGQLQGASSINDPALKGQSDAYRTARERSAQQERGALAERDAFLGLNSGGAGSGSFETGIQGIQEQSGQDIAGHDAGLVGQDVQQKRQSLMTLLNMALQTGDAESVRALQLQLAQMDQQYKSASLAQQGSQFNDQFGLNVANSFDDRQYRNAVLAALGGL